jgi:uncharacterized membrane protein
MVVLPNSIRVFNLLKKAANSLLQRGPVFYLSLILLLGISLRLFHLTYNSLWLDEGFSFWLASKDVRGILEAAVASEDEPLYYIVLHYWMYLGHSELALRLLSVTCSLVSIILIYEVAKTIFGSSIALVAAFLLSIAPLDVWYSQEIGRFALGNLLALGSIYGFIGFLTRRKVIYWMLYVVATVAMMYTFYVSFVIILVQNFYLLFAGLWLNRHRDLAVKWVISQMVVLAAFSPWWPRFVGQTHHVGGVSLFINAARILKQLGVTVEISSISLEYIALLIGIGVTVLLILGKPMLALWHRLFKHPYFFAWAVPSYLVVLLVSGWRPLSSVRLMLIFLPPFLLAMAVGFSRSDAVVYSRRRLWLTLLVMPTLVALGINYFVNQKENWRDAAYIVEVNANPGDVILIQPSYCQLPFGYYYSGNLAYEHADRPEQDLARVVRQYSRIWFVVGLNHAQYYDPDGLVQRWLDAHGTLLLSLPLTRIDVRLYQF